METLKSLLLLSTILMFSCNNSAKTIEVKDEGAINACQYLREQLGSLSDNIDSMEVLGVDSLLSDIQPMFEQSSIFRSGIDFLENKINAKEYRKRIENYQSSIERIMNSWLYQSYNDSIKKCEEFSSELRRVYLIRVKMKNNTTQDVRIMMDNDGITPRYTEAQLSKALEEYTKTVKQAYDTLLY